jgi:hypothetical protein
MATVPRLSSPAFFPPSAISPSLQMKTATATYPVGLKPVRLFVLLLGFVLSACTSVHLISDYDEGIDKGITDLQKSTETFFTKLDHTGRSVGPLSTQEQDFLDQASVAITALQIRAAALPKNDITSSQLALLKDSVSTLGELLKAGITREQIQPIRNAFNTSTAAILKLELAKKRGNNSTK